MHLCSDFGGDNMEQTKIERNNYWKELRILRNEWDSSVFNNASDVNTRLSLIEYVKIKYGFLILLDRDGAITDKFDVIDKETYLMYKLKGTK